MAGVSTVVSSSDDGVGVCDERISTAVPVLFRLIVTSPIVVGCGSCSISPTPFLKFGNGTGSRVGVDGPRGGRVAVDRQRGLVGRVGLALG